jgi:hypothetical protein
MVFNATFNSYIMAVSLIDGGNQRPIMIIGYQSGNILITVLSRHHIYICAYQAITLIRVNFCQSLILVL